RRQMRLGVEALLPDLAEAAVVGCDRALIVQEKAAVPKGRVLAVVGWKQNPGPLVAVRPLSTAENARFLYGRALWFALRGTTRSARLVTDARTRDQSASRAFSA